MIRPPRLASCPFVATLLLVTLHAATAMTLEERRAYLENLRHILPDAPAFNAWLEKSRELPPDFDSLPRVNPLPDPLRFLNGQPVRTAAEWKARRAEILSLYEKYQLGTVPSKPHLDQ